MQTLKQRLVAGYTQVVNDPKASNAEILAALNALKELGPDDEADGAKTTDESGVEVTPTEAAQGSPPPSERFGHDKPAAGVPPVVLGGQSSGWVAGDTPVDPQPATARERADMRKGRRSLP